VLTVCLSVFECKLSIVIVVIVSREAKENKFGQLYART